MNDNVYIIDGNRFERNMSIEIHNLVLDTSEIFKLTWQFFFEKQEHWKK